MLRRGLERAGDRLLVLAGLATVLALVVPSHALAQRSDVELAAVGLVALAGGSAVLALGALAGSLVVAALLGPVLLGVLAGGAAGIAVGELVARFALVVLVPLAVGLAARAAVPRLEHA